MSAVRPETTRTKILVFGNDGVIVPLKKIAHIARQSPTSCRIHLVSYGFVDVTIPFDELVDQLIGIYG